MLISFASQILLYCASTNSESRATDPRNCYLPLRRQRPHCIALTSSLYFLVCIAPKLVYFFELILLGLGTGIVFYCISRIDSLRLYLYVVAIIIIIIIQLFL